MSNSSSEIGSDRPSPSPERVAGIDPLTLMRIRNLEFRAKVVVDGFLSGLHRSPHHGFSVEFSEYRQYSPGDDPRYLDWRLFARTDRYYVKRFQDETNLRCYLLVDLSRSMAYGSLPYDKAEYARTAAATLAYFLSLQRDAVGLVTFDERIRDYLPARYRAGHIHRLMLALEQSPTGKATRLEIPLEQVASTVRKRGLVILLSDCLAQLDSLETHLGYLRSQGHEVILLRVLDPAEISLSIPHPALVEDLETGRTFYVDPDSARAEYEQRFREHASRLRRICLAWDVDFASLVTDQPLDMSLFELLHARWRRGRKMVSRKPSGVSAAGGRR